MVSLQIVVISCALTRDGEFSVFLPSHLGWSPCLMLIISKKYLHSDMGALLFASQPSQVG